MAGPQDPAAAGRDQLRVGHADREQVIEALKAAFVHGRLTKAELDARAGQALAARTYADLATLTADIPGEPAAARPARPPAPARRRPLVRAAAGSGGCMVIAFAAMQVAVRADPGNTPGTLPGSLAFPSFLVANAAVFAAVLIVIYGVVIAVEQRRSRRQLPPRPGAGGRALEGERRGDTGDGPVPLVPAPARPAPTCGLTAHGRVGRIPPGGMPGRRAAYGRYRAPGNRPRSPFSLVRPYVCRFTTWCAIGAIAGSRDHPGVPLLR
jgi:hypothetical protein